MIGRDALVVYHLKRRRYVKIPDFGIQIEDVGVAGWLWCYDGVDDRYGALRKEGVLPLMVYVRKM